MSRTKFVRGMVAASVLATGAVAAMSPTPASAQATSATKAYLEVPTGATAFPVGNYSITPANVTLTGDNTGLVFTMDDGTGTDFVLTLTPRIGETFGDVDPTDAAAPSTNVEDTSVATATATDAGMTLTRTGSTCTNPTGDFSIDGASLAVGPAFGAAVQFTIKCAGEAAAYSATGQAYVNQPLDPLRAPQAGEFVSLDPVRLIDTRLVNFFGSGSTGQIGAGTTLDVDVTTNLNGAASGVPANALAVVLNLTAISPTANTFLSLYPTGTARPLVSNLNPVSGDTVANISTVKVGTAGKVTLYNELGSTHAVIDVVGYYAPENGAVGGGSRYVAQTPVRKLDTREPSGGAAPLAAGATRTLDLGIGATPDGAIVNLTVEAPTAGGYAAIFPGGTTTVLNVSNVNFVAGQTAANMVVTKVVNGEIQIYNPTAGTVHVMVDLIGVFNPDVLNDGIGMFVPVAPVRSYDSREPGDTPLAARTARDVNLLVAEDLYPFEYTSVMANLTVTNGTGPGYLNAFPSAGTIPFVSNVNWPTGKTVANQIVSGTDADGFTGFFHGADVTNTSVDFIVDVAGYFTQG